MSSAPGRIGLALLCILMVGCDRFTKQAAADLLAERTLDLVPGVFSLHYTENHDVAFSILSSYEHQHKALLLGLMALTVLLLTLAVWFKRRRAPGLEQVGYALIVGGAIGNVLDRLTRGYVIDFMHVRYWPVFNVADVAIVAGTGLVLLSACFVQGARVRAR